jgi:hypothetical protein
MPRLDSPQAADQKPPPAAPNASTHPGKPTSSNRIKALLRDYWPAALVAAVIALRDPTPLFRAEFWAEDATEFFFDALGLGIKSLWVPVYGYHFLLNRIIAYGATALPVLYAPYVYAWTAFLVNVLSVAYCVRDGFSWLLPERWQRIVLAVALAIGPGSADIFFIQCSLPSSLGLLALWLLLERPWGLGRVKLAALLLILPCCGYAILWLPLVAYLWWASRDRGYAIVGLAMALMAAVNVWGSHHAVTESGLAGYQALQQVPWIVVENAHSRLVLAPILGSKLTGMILGSPAALFWTTAALGVALVAATVRWAFAKHREAVLALGCAYLGAIGSLGIVALGRNYAIRTLLREGGTISWNSRYALLPGVVATLVWLGCLVHLDRPGMLWRAARALVAVIMAVHIASHWSSVHPRPDLHWPDKSIDVQAIVDQTGASGRVITVDDLAVQPEDWEPSNGRVAIVLPSS